MQPNFACRRVCAYSATLAHGEQMLRRRSTWARTLRVWVARSGGMWRAAFLGATFNILRSNFSALPAALATKGACWVIGLPPSTFLGTIPSRRPPARGLLGNQNQLLVLSPLSPFWLGIKRRVVFSESSV